MTRRPPIVATVIVAASVALMTALGVWQLQRAKLHQAQLASYQSAARLPPIIFPAVPAIHARLNRAKAARKVLLQRLPALLMVRRPG